MNKTTPKEFFTHLLAFATLYASAVSLISLWWQYIDIKLPDPLIQYYAYGYEPLRVPMAALIVVFPVFLLLARWMSRGIVSDPRKKDLWIYKWLVYLTLFVSSITIIIDLVVLIYNFLGGELTARIGLKTLVILIVALGVFGYYLWHLRSDLSQTEAKRKTLLWITVLAVVGSIIAGFFIVGSPSTARTRRYDMQRINDLQNIQWHVISYWQAKNKLPTTLSELFNPLEAGQISGVDPKTYQPYEYRLLAPLKFELCANFALHGGQMGNIIYSRVLPLGIDPKDQKQDNWQHDAGRVCFERTIDPDLYSTPKPVR